MAREQAEKSASQGTQSETSVCSHAPDVVAVSVETSVATVSVGSSTTSTLAGVALSPVPVTPVATDSNPSPVAIPGSSVVSGAQPVLSTIAAGFQHQALAPPPPSVVSASTGVPAASINSNSSSMYGLILVL